MPERKERRGQQEKQEEVEQKEHKFWDKQPIPHEHDAEQVKVAEGPIEDLKTVEQVQPEPYPLPKGYEWFIADVNDATMLNNMFELLKEHYVEDDDQMFRFCYTQDFLKWALTPPGWFPEWHVGVRVISTGMLVGLITGVPAQLRVRDSLMKVAEINYLCVHKKLRHKRLAPVLIKEVTRRVNLKNMWQAVYTTGIKLPGSITSCTYWHRSLNPEKLISIGFSRIPPSFSKFQRPMEQTKRHFKLPEKPQMKGFRAMVQQDVEGVTELLNKYLTKFVLVPIFEPEDVAHWLLPREGVVNSYVVENEGKLTDFISFYTLPSTIIKSEKYNLLKAAYCYYMAPSGDLVKLMTDALIMAKSMEYDVFNALDLMDNSSMMKDMKFGIGDGSLQYYLYNWRTPNMKPEDLALVML